MVMKTFLVIVHIPSVEEESSILRLCNEGIPFRCVAIYVARYIQCFFYVQELEIICFLVILDEEKSYDCYFSVFVTHCLNSS